MQEKRNKRVEGREKKRRAVVETETVKEGVRGLEEKKK
jgi:hypothetical protein